MQNFIDDNIERAEKWGSCLAICIDEPKGNTNKVKSQVKNIVTPGTKKWVLKYVVTSGSGRMVGTKITKGDAVKIAREHTEKHKNVPILKWLKYWKRVHQRLQRLSTKKHH